jgi:hypothetical protein
MKKILTILIFSGDRFCIKNLLNDIVKLDNKNIDIKVVEWTEKKKILIKKKKIYLNFFKKIKNFSVDYEYGNWELKYLKFINKFNSKYILVIGDDDRINVSNFKKIFKYLNLNFSGITLSFQNFTSTKEIKKFKNFSSNVIRPFDIYTDLNKIGFTSCQIIRTDLINKIFEKVKKSLLKTQFPQNFIILKIIKKFNNWKVIDLKCIHNHFGNIDYFIKEPKRILIRLKSEYEGYFVPLKENYFNFSKNKLEKIYKEIFFKNILSWLFLSLKYCGKKNTYITIKKHREIIHEPLLVKVSLFLFYISPFFILNFMKIVRRMIVK